ncbi:mechanosensitive ion channel domain-containing protein [Thiothrix lacustris]|uniref:mechanosensitive ion channel domain-containing protein n=1 Tax=Thiothrix lacustris TaxID=525917 RepID=UPI0027E4B9DC|nr:mechanosensitive ion channel domain-containing protein [Thiothrix lacustris]WMP16656.1 mechanosensitive ion channel [Thiothrix lacustris]
MKVRAFLWIFLWCLPLFSSSLHADELTNLLTGKTDSAVAGTDKVISTGSSVQSDKKIRERLHSIFRELEAIKTVSISVNNGVVTLDGEVDSSASETKALQFAKQVEGVVEVQNALVINRSMSKRLQNTWDKLLVMGKQTIAALPLFLLGLLVFLLFWMLGGWISRRQNLFRRISPNAFIANLLGQMTHLVFIMFGLVLALTLLDATALLGTILGAAGIVGLAVGFAVRDTVENYIASILLSVRNPFEVNDLVNIDNFEGNVASLNSRATVLISPDGNHIRIPNATVFKAIITNFTRNPERRFQFDVGVDTNQNLLVAQTLALETLQIMPGVMPDPKPAVLIEALGDSNVQLRIFGWVDQRQHNFGKVRSEAIRGVKQAFDQASIVMPEPIYNLRISQQTETPTALKPSVASVIDRRDVQDVSVDRTIADKVQEEQQVSDSENLLTANAPKE